jgi:sugar lactone lactonase YvrE
MSLPEAQLLFEAGAELGEGPVWDSRIGRLWWVDITASKLHRFDPESLKDEAFDVGSHIGAAVPEEGGELLLAVKDGFARFSQGKVSPLSLMGGAEPDSRNIRFNDGKCDPAGRFWAGTMAYDGSAGAGNLFCLERDLSVSRKIKGVTISNGLDWSVDSKEMYYIDTPTQRVLAFAYDSLTGAIGQAKVAVEIDKAEGSPDGMCVDNFGALWIALWNGGKLIRCNAKTGERLGEVQVPGASRVTSCAFGGPGLETLYITTARGGEAQPAQLGGSLFSVRPGAGIHGLPANRFKAL